MAYGRGIRYFDVARSYGRAEEFLAAWLRAHPEADDAVIGVQAALRFTLADSGVSTVIPGMKNLAQLTSSLAAADEDLPADTVAALRALFAERIAGDPLPW